MRRLYLQVYLTIVAGLLAVVLVGGGLWRLAAEGPPARHAFEVAGELAQFALPPADAPIDEQRDAVHRIAQRLHIDLGLFNSDRAPVAAAGSPVPRPSERDQGGWIRGPGGPAWAIALPDGRWVVARTPRRRPERVAFGLIGFLAAMASLIALAAWPVARRLTHRLERLQQGVEQLGRGDLSARVKVEGRDEVARLATSFNAAAERIEHLVGAHKLLLANASHEIRTPLSRIRLGLELMQKDGGDPARKAALATDIAELDHLLDEILLSSRLDTVEANESRETVDLLALAAEETARYDHVGVSGTPIFVTGDARLLRRLVRNLLENATRHGAPPIEVDVAARPGLAVLTVRDHGSGVPVSERERVFEPFRRGPGAAGRPGTGLGLSLVRQIAKRHGGDAVIIEPGNAICVTLPVANSPAHGIVM